MLDEETAVHKAFPFALPFPFPLNAWRAELLSSRESLSFSSRHCHLSSSYALTLFSNILVEYYYPSYSSIFIALVKK